MNFVSAMLIIAATTTAAEPLDYKTAYKRAMKGDKPLLILVTAEWCRPCQVMKKTTIPTMLADEKFKGVFFTAVDLDKQQRIARELVGNKGVPQLVIFEKDKGLWNTRSLVGIQSVGSVEKFLEKSPQLRTAKAQNVAVGH